MSRKLTAADRSALIRLASTLPAGSEERKAILAGLEKSAVSTGAGIVGKFHLFRAVEARSPEILEIIDEVGKRMPRHRRLVDGWKEGRVSDRDMATLLWNLWNQEGLLKALGVDPDWKPSLRSASMNDLGFDDFLPPSELVKRGETAADNIGQNAKNLKQAMSRYSDDQLALDKWTLRIFGQMLMFGIKPALDGRFSDLADEAYRLGQKMQKQYKR